MNMNPVLRLFCSQISLETSNKALLDLQANYRVAISTLKEKELIISNLLCSGGKKKKKKKNISFQYFWLLLTKNFEFLCMSRKFFS